MSNVEGVRRHRMKMKRQQRCQRCGGRDYRTYRARALCRECAVKASRTMARVYRQRAQVQ